MRILAINGSHHGRHGFTHYCLEMVLDGARGAGAECETVNLSEISIHCCTGCNECQSKDSPNKCIFDGKDDLQMVLDKMRSADLILYSTPIHIFTITSLFKIFLDRINATGISGRMTMTKAGLFFHEIDHTLCSKPFATLITCDNFEDETPKNAMEYFKTFSRFMDARQVGSLVRKTGMRMRNEQDAENENLRIMDARQAFFQAGKELAVKGRISAGTQRRANRDILGIPPVIRLFMKFKPFKKRVFDMIQDKKGVLPGFREVNHES